MTSLNSLLREDQDLQFNFSNFTKSDTMEEKKGGSSTTLTGAKSLQDLKQVLNELKPNEALTVKGGGPREKDKWNSMLGGNVPQ